MVLPIIIWPWPGKLADLVWPNPDQKFTDQFSGPNKKPIKFDQFWTFDPKNVFFSFLLEIPKFSKNQRRRLKRSLSWTAQNEYQINQVSKEIQKTSGKKRSSIIWV